ncbi:MAG: hypothetical protein DMF80_23335 [Acidobacteria bacterium]|nr:MAG: hypothetical protein DMF80_23335 [Acidobacteriota bacterium]
MSGRRAVTRVRAHGRAAALLAGAVTLAACGSSSSGSSGGGGGSLNNVQAIEVGLGPSGSLVNGLFTSVTICVPGTSNCQTIDGVQVDTGSVGLRLLASRVSLSLPRIADGNGNAIGNCASFVDNSYAWGPMATADVQMADEKAPSVPIQLINAPGFAAVPSDCANGGTAADSVSALGANGLLGLGVFRQDCGSACSGPVSRAPAVYFSCPASGCSVASVPLQSQLQNPVWLFPQDNNGLIVSLPEVPAQGARTVSGSLIFGIGTRSNNGLEGARVFTTDDVGDFVTTFNGARISSSYLDTGSNGYFFLDSDTIGLPPCPDGDSDFSCPPSTVTYTAVTTGLNGASTQVTFNVANAETLFNTGNAAFDDLAGPDTGDFDWGLPFFFGRKTFIAIEGQSTAGGTGPYWAY